jgi:hypothetical protein
MPACYGEETNWLYAGRRGHIKNKTVRKKK